MMDTRMNSKLLKMLLLVLMSIVVTSCSQFCPYYCSLFSETSNETEIEIHTGGSSGTYYQFGNDLKELYRKYGINLTVNETKGSIDNLERVYASCNLPTLQLGIVQEDILEWGINIPLENEVDDAVKEGVKQNIKVVFPLYKEEVHILARRNDNIINFDDLQGRRVAIGSKGSGTNITANLLFYHSGVAPSEKFEISYGEALDKLKNG